MSRINTSASSCWDIFIHTSYLVHMLSFLGLLWFCFIDITMMLPCFTIIGQCRFVNVRNHRKRKHAEWVRRHITTQPHVNCWATLHRIHLKSLTSIDIGRSDSTSESISKVTATYFNPCSAEITQVLDDGKGHPLHPWWGMIMILRRKCNVRMFFKRF